MPNVKASLLINKPFFAGLKKRYYICNVLTIMETVFSVSYQETESFQNFFPFDILPVITNSLTRSILESSNDAM